MIKLIELFFLILSILFFLKNVLIFVVTLKEENPEPMVLSTAEQVLLYLSATYIITFITGAIIGII